MLKISQFKVKIPHTKEEIEKKLCKSLQIQAGDLKEWSIEKQSLDARKKPELFYVYTICVKLSGEQQILKKLGKKKLNFDINPYTPKEYRFPDAGEVPHIGLEQNFALQHHGELGGSGTHVDSERGGSGFDLFKNSQWDYLTFYLYDGKYRIREMAIRRRIIS